MLCLRRTMRRPATTRPATMKRRRKTTAAEIPESPCVLRVGSLATSKITECVEPGMFESSKLNEPRASPVADGTMRTRPPWDSPIVISTRSESSTSAVHPSGDSMMIRSWMIVLPVLRISKCNREDSSTIDSSIESVVQITLGWAATVMNAPADFSIPSALMVKPSSGCQPAGVDSCAAVSYTHLTLPTNREV